MRVERAMTKNVFTCLAHQTLEQAARTMWEADIGCLVVIDEDRRPIGMITDRDIAMAAYTQGVALRDALVSSAMSHRVLTTRPDARLSEVESSMRSEQVRRIPVVEPSGTLVGIVTLGDLAHAAQSGPLGIPVIPRVAKTLSSVTERRKEGRVAS
jgi:CBS domain-containing protein